MKLLKISICLSLFMVACKNKSDDAKKNTESIVVEKPTVKFNPVDNVELSGGTLYRAELFPSSYITPRPVDVWLPDNYSADKKYNVLYMHDGQMLFDAKTTWNKQEWKVDEWATNLQKEGKVKDFIVVAIHNISNIRWLDLFPKKAFDFIDAQKQAELKSIPMAVEFKLSGDDYLRFLVNELKPLIDEKYSVYTDKEHTFVMGSSMGGLMSMYAISEYPTIFGGAACISTHWIGSMPMADNPYPKAIFEYMKINLPESKDQKLYFDYGDKTLDAYYPKYASQVDEILESKGYNEINSKNIFFEGADHSENSWNVRLDQPLTFLLGI
ncbi:esterase [Tenacibaculum sp. SZ-18]|uniref:alpha/beta hydrolase n=1 Tax=Tenacibaculum sp. SZ-18 TaxID=754423 RepID=UPI000C2D4B68|nr:alpha/beta hydrolase-fold protein [Tenacibaculum sp. SZ-18]AUC14900.1 esterase [Tenacibaculum sp. SZ-18]